jgi:hypothetical protein
MPAGYVAPPNAKDPNEDPYVAAAKKETRAIRDAIHAQQQADLSAKADLAEQARSALDTVFRLTSGEGFGSVAGSTAEERAGKTLLSRVTLRPRSISSAASPYIANAATSVGSVGTTPAANTILSNRATIQPVRGGTSRQMAL